MSYALKTRQHPALSPLKVAFVVVSLVLGTLYAKERYDESQYEANRAERIIVGDGAYGQQVVWSR